MNHREIWISAIISAVITQIAVFLDETIRKIMSGFTPEIVSGVQVFAIIAFVIAGIFLWYDRKNKHVHEDLTTEKSSFPILPEFRKDYHNHIVGLFEEIKKNVSPVLEEPDYFTALQKTKEKKRMIFQHLYTMDSLSDMYSSMFSIYQLSVATFNDVDKKKKQLLRDLEDYDEKLDSYDFGNSDDEWIDIKLFKKAIGIKRNDSTEDILNDKPLYNFPSGLNCSLYVKPENEEFKLGWAGHWFAKCKDKEKLNKFQKFIEENGTKLMQEIQSVHSSRGTAYEYGSLIFNQEFKEHDEALEGEPVLGACTTCLESWFNQENVKKYKPILDQFNSVRYNYSEEAWTREKFQD